MPLPPAEPLYDELSFLRSAEDSSDPRHGKRWRVVALWVKRAFAGHGPEAEDARQETMISLLRNVGRMRAEAPLQCAKWVSTIHRRKRVDELRVMMNDPVRQAMKHEPKREDQPPLVERLGCEGRPTLTPDALESLVTAVLGHVHEAIDASTKSASKRLLRRAQAQATLLRVVCGWDADAVVEALEYGEPLGRDRIYKWVERGRGPVLLGLDLWAMSAEGHEVGVIEVLREMVEDRRADAGIARPDRRKEPTEEPA